MVSLTGNKQTDQSVHRCTYGSHHYSGCRRTSRALSNNAPLRLQWCEKWNAALLCQCCAERETEYGGVCICCVHSFSTTCYSVQQRWRRKQRTGGDVLARGHGCALISTLTHLAPTRLLTWNSGERTDSWGRAAVSPVNNLQRQAFTACWPALRAAEDIDPHWHVMYKLLQSFSGLRWINDQF